MALSKLVLAVLFLLVSGSFNCSVLAGRTVKLGSYVPKLPKLPNPFKKGAGFACKLMHCSQYIRPPPPPPRRPF